MEMHKAVPQPLVTHEIRLRLKKEESTVVLLCFLVLVITLCHKDLVSTELVSVTPKTPFPTFVPRSATVSCPCRLVSVLSSVWTHHVGVGDRELFEQESNAGAGLHVLSRYRAVVGKGGLRVQTSDVQGGEEHRCFCACAV